MINIISRSLDVGTRLFSQVKAAGNRLPGFVKDPCLYFGLSYAAYLGMNGMSQSLAGKNFCFFKDTCLFAGIGYIVKLMYQSRAQIRNVIDPLLNDEALKSFLLSNAI
jgi:hypothetical protein